MYVSEEDKNPERVSYFAQSQKTRKRLSQDSNLGLLTRCQGFLSKGSVFLPFHTVAYLGKYESKLTTLEFYSIG